MIGDKYKLIFLLQNISKVCYDIYENFVISGNKKWKTDHREPSSPQNCCEFNNCGILIDADSGRVRRVKNMNDFQALINLIDRFRELNYSKKRKKRTITP